MEGVVGIRTWAMSSTQKEAQTMHRESQEIYSLYIFISVVVQYEK
jgi:hypothetical protein